MARLARLAPSAAQNMEDLWQSCRSGRNHWWYDVEPSGRPQFGVRIEMACEKCGTVRFMNVDRRGVALTSWNYIHPEGYSMLERMTAEEYRAYKVRKKGGRK